MSSFPTNLRYTPDHEWVEASGASWKVGITQFAVDQLGDITLVDLPNVGDLVTKGQRFGTVESVKSVSDLYAPVSGKVASINTALKDSPENVNADSFSRSFTSSQSAAWRRQRSAMRSNSLRLFWPATRGPKTTFSKTDLGKAVDF